MSAQPSTEIPGRLLRSGLRRRHSSTFTLRQSTSLDCAAHSVTGLSLLERTARRSPRPVAQCRWLPANDKDSFVHQMLMSSAPLRCCEKSATPRPWNSLPSDIRQPDLSYGQFRLPLKTFLFGLYMSTAKCDPCCLRLRNALTYLLTYLLTTDSDSPASLLSTDLDAVLI